LYFTGREDLEDDIDVLINVEEGWTLAFVESRAGTRRVVDRDERGRTGSCGGLGRGFGRSGDDERLGWNV